MSTAGPMVADLRAESDDLDAMVADLPAARARAARGAPARRHPPWPPAGERPRDSGFPTNDHPVPPEPFRVELNAPDGATWSWGPDDATQRVTGSAEDFCMLVTQRR